MCVFEEENKNTVGRIMLTLRKGQIVTVEGIYIDQLSYPAGLYKCKIVSL